jgi:hypothetical protein
MKVKLQPPVPILIGEAILCRGPDVGEDSRLFPFNNPNSAKQKKWFGRYVSVIADSELGDKLMCTVGGNRDCAVTFQMPQDVIDQDEQTVNTNARAPRRLSLSGQQSF